MLQRIVFQVILVPEAPVRAGLQPFVVAGQLGPGVILADLTEIHVVFGHVRGEKQGVPVHKAKDPVIVAEPDGGVERLDTVGDRVSVGVKPVVADFQIVAVSGGDLREHRDVFAVQVKHRGIIAVGNGIL